MIDVVSTTSTLTYGMDLRLNWLAWSLVLALAVAQEGLNYETDLTMWIDPRCQEGIVQSFNEVRFGYQQLRRALHETPVPKWLNEATNRWFGFDTTESEYMEYLDSVCPSQPVDNASAHTCDRDNTSDGFADSRGRHCCVTIRPVLR